MTDERPNPDELLQQIEAEAPERRKGRLEIFFGYAAGVGKTYAMLQAAQALEGKDVDLLVGYVETHDRPETNALLEGLEVLPRRTVDYRGITLSEFDLDAALARRPQLVLVDELAHTNAQGMRHTQRWQDVEELLDAGIDVYTTLNVQHLESLNDVVAQVTGVTVRETVPDAIFDRADEVKLVDVPPDELLQRFSEGKVYVPAQAELAAQNFFRKERLIALREIALRRMADHVNTEVDSARRRTKGAETWPTSERILVSVGPSPSSAKVIREARRMADAYHAPWVAVTVESPTTKGLSPPAQRQLVRNLRLAERLGAQVWSLRGESVSRAIANYAVTHNITKILLGQPVQNLWQRLTQTTVIDELMRLSGDIDVNVIRGAEEARQSLLPPSRRSRLLRSHFGMALVMALSLGIALAFSAWGFTEANVVMVLLVGVLVSAARFGLIPGLVASLAGVAMFNFFFTQPYYTFNVYDSQYLITFAVMFGVALFASGLTARIGAQAKESEARERRTQALLRLSRELVGASGQEQTLRVAAQEISESLGDDVAVLVPDANRRLVAPKEAADGWDESEHELVVAQWSFEHGQLAGRGTDTLPDAAALYIPLRCGESVLGVLATRLGGGDEFYLPEVRQLYESFAAQIAQALERVRIVQESQRMTLQAETERLRNLLLSSVSHDLRTPLAAITGASSTLLAQDAEHLPPALRELGETIYDESRRLSRLVDNILHMTRIEAAQVTLKKEWIPPDEVVGSALSYMERALADRKVDIHIDDALSAVPMDGVLVEQVLINLLDNACKYTPPGSPIAMRFVSRPGEARCEIADQGPGLPPGEEEAIFQKFYRGAGPAVHSQRGAGLGLTICRAIVEAHGGRIWARNRPEGGAVFTFSLPITGTPPVLKLPATLDEAEEAAAQPHGQR